jgi:hypothetical protein
MSDGQASPGFFLFLFFFLWRVKEEALVTITSKQKKLLSHLRQTRRKLLLVKSMKMEQVESKNAQQACS